MRMHWQRQIARNETHLTSVDVVLFQLVERLRREAAAERTLKICEFDNGHWRVGPTERVGATDIRQSDAVVGRALGCRGGRLRRTLRKSFDRLADCAQLLEDFVSLLL